ncbi:DUF2157 domain-containing protein [Ancylomarina sp.]|uniref:DUF2157 domain-containing protein n=1 Tax=Ancylomarina sp. TaxID=1970196 RepID=UPI0035636F75
MSIYKDIQELLSAELISDNQAENIREYYRKKESQSGNKLFIVFGILGAILIGLGLILIIAHNWDELSRLTKTIFAFIPLLIGQILCGYTLMKKQDNVAWREGSTVFLFLTVGASISLVSQIYNIPGNLSSFLLTWILVCIPLVYIMTSSITSLFSIIGITFYACETGYWNHSSADTYLYWLMLLAILPHYYQLYKKRPESNSMIFHNWLIPISLVISLGTFSHSHDEFMFIAYFSLFACLYIVGNTSFFSQQKLRNNAYKILGSLGTLILLLVLSFDWFWDDLRNKIFDFNEVVASPEFIVSTSLTILAGLLLYLQQKNKRLLSIKPISLVFIFFIYAFISGLSSSIAMLLINFYVFAIGIFTIREGAKKDHLGILNFGLLIITALVTCRFFDENLSFVIRGILFVSVGLGFFATNYVMFKKRKNG